ncbi:MAG: hypothetical protein Q7T82_21540 [Armatimonadota bacterium]|nr:hypothetical protein [Armatimonadota bacterium]
MEKIEYGGWPNCIRLTNGTVELVATTDVGPRIIRYGFVGQDNEFHEAASDMGKIGGDEWRGYGGHRLWHAPEAKPRTYFPDNSPVRFEMNSDTLRLTQEVEPTTGMQKEIAMTTPGENGHVRVTHKITNTNLWPVEFAPWALTVMHGGGKAIFPQEPYSPHPDIPDYPGQKIDPKYYLPARNLIMWSYTKLSDPRWVYTDKYLLLKQDPKAERPQKIGMSNRQGWAAYARNGHLFVKTSQYQEGAVYPDGGCSFETFTNADMLEVETLGPVVNLAPGAGVTHIEDWYLFDGVEFEERDESIDGSVRRLVGL